MSTDNIIPANQASGAYRRANFESFDEPREQPPAPEPEVREAPPPLAQEEALVEHEELQPLEIAPGIKLPTADEIEAMHQEAFKQGFDAGYEEGSARGRLEASELHQLLTQFDEALTGFDQQVGEELLALALEVARQVVRDSLAQKPEAVLGVIREALGQTPQQHAQLHVHPEDADLVRQYLGEQIAHTGHRIVEDANIERGGCRIDSAGAQMDATIATRWRRVVETLSGNHPWADAPEESDS
ncbi:flagellar assembly protein FliH [Niveibacterium terrae]|uniref:flagellar assembly protein FliH n=1 Tax=Niveibacterium terrae TaxID=3373598 RepID=UPI003A95BEE3